MTEIVPDNHKKYRQFIWTSAMNLFFLVILALYVHSLMQTGVLLLGTNGNNGIATLPQIIYVIGPPAFGLVGLLLAVVWKPLSRGIIVLLAMHYLLMLSVILLLGYADITLLITHFSPVSPDTLILFALLVVLIFLSFWNVKSLKDLDLPSIFGKR
jgi:hypothetical protein